MKRSCYFKILYCMSFLYIAVLLGCQKSVEQQKRESITPELNKITVTVKCDDGIELKKLNSFKLNKGIKWSGLKTLVEVSVKAKSGMEVKEWRLNDANGEILQETQDFDNDVVIFAVSQAIKEKGNISITIKCDERLKVEGETQISLPFSTVSSGIDLIKNLIPRISFKSEWSSEDYEIYDFRLDNEEGKRIENSDPVASEITVFVRSNYKKFRMSKTDIPNYYYLRRDSYNPEPRGRIIIPSNVCEIESLTFSNCKELVAVDFSGCSKLKEIPNSSFENCISLKKLNFSGCSSLRQFTSLQVRGCIALEKLNFSGCNNITQIEASDGAIKDVNLTACSNLVFLYLNNDKIETIDISSCKKLVYLYLEKNPLKEIDVLPCKKLKIIDLSDTEITSINLSSCSKLDTIYLNNTKINSIDFTPCNLLKNIILQSVPIRDIDLSKCTNLVLLMLSNAQIKNINLSSCKKLTYVYFKNCKELEQIDLSACHSIREVALDNWNDWQEAFSGCIKAEVTLPNTIKQIGAKAFGSEEATFCKKVKVPNDTVKALVVDSGYPESRIEKY